MKLNYFIADWASLVKQWIQTRDSTGTQPPMPQGFQSGLSWSSSQTSISNNPQQTVNLSHSGNSIDLGLLRRFFLKGFTQFGGVAMHSS